MDVLELYDGRVGVDRQKERLVSAGTIQGSSQAIRVLMRGAVGTR